MVKNQIFAMHKTESLNFDGRRNPRRVEQKDQSVDARDLEGSRTTSERKKSNKLLLWCARCWGKKKKKKETDKRVEKKSAKKSIFKKLKESRCWGRRKRDRDGEAEKGEKGEKGEEIRDSSSYKSRAGTSSRDSEGRLIADKSDSRISVEERERSRAERPKEKKRKPKRESTRPEKSVSYADTHDFLNNQKKRADEIVEKYDGTLRDIAKSCCYLCTENSLAIAAAMTPRPVRFDKSVEADVPEMLEKSCSPIKLGIHVRTVKSLIRIKVRDTCTSYVEIPEDRKRTKVKKKRKKFRIFPKVKRTECPVRRTVGCVTENTKQSTSGRDGNSKQKEKRTFEPCCKDKAV